MRFLSKIIGFVLAAALFGVTVSCTVDLLGQILPAKYWYLPALSTAAFDVGIIAWLLTLLYVVENSEQRTIAAVMLVIDFVGVAITTIADVFFYDATKGLVEAFPTDWIRWIIVGLVAVILLNVLAWIGMHIFHPKYIYRATGKPGTSLDDVPVQRVRVVEAGQQTKRVAAARTAQLPAPQQRETVPGRSPKAAQPATRKAAVRASKPAEKTAQAPALEAASFVEEQEVEETQADEEQYEEETQELPVADEEDHDDSEYEEYVEGDQVDEDRREASKDSVPLRQRVAGAWNTLVTPKSELPVNKLKKTKKL